VQNVLGGDGMVADSRTPDIMADCVTDFEKYHVVPCDAELKLDLFLDN
jgi:hypothetical protein